jgi:hypothetical protein
VVDIKRMIEQPETTTELTTTVSDALVFALSLPYVGTTSVPVQQLQSWVKQQWETVPPDAKKSGRRMTPAHMAAAEVEAWLLDPFKAMYIAQVNASSFTETYTAADTTIWCNMHTVSVSSPLHQEVSKSHIHMHSQPYGLHSQPYVACNSGALHLPGGLPAAADGCRHSGEKGEKGHLYAVD